MAAADTAVDVVSPPPIALAGGTSGIYSSGPGQPGLRDYGAQMSQTLRRLRGTDAVVLSDVLLVPRRRRTTSATPASAQGESLESSPRDGTQRDRDSVATSRRDSATDTAAPAAVLFPTATSRRRAEELESGADGSDTGSRHDAASSHTESLRGAQPVVAAVIAAAAPGLRRPLTAALLRARRRDRAVRRGLSLALSPSHDLGAGSSQAAEGPVAVEGDPGAPETSGADTTQSRDEATPSRGTEDPPFAGATYPTEQTPCAPSAQRQGSEGVEPRMPQVEVAVSPTALPVFVDLLYGIPESLADVSNAAVLWEIADACRELRVTPGLARFVDEELERRGDEVDIDAIFQMLTGPEDDISGLDTGDTTGTGTAARDEQQSGRPGGYNIATSSRSRLLAARKYVRQNFTQVAQSEQWVELPVATVERVLKMNDLVLNGGELDVFRAVLAWGRHAGNSHSDAVKLLRLVRFPAMSDDDLLAVVRCEFFAADEVFYRMVLEAFARRAEVRIIYAPRNERRLAHGPRYGSAVSELLLVHRRTPNAPVSHAKLNARGVRTAAFKGFFPLPLYRHMRFRSRSPSALLFTSVISGWSSVSGRIRTESRTFLDHRWSLWIDPHALQETTDDPALGLGAAASGRMDSNGGEDAGALPAGTQSTSAVSRADQSSYVSIFLCCHSDLPATGRHASVDVTVDYSLFIASSADPYVMERKVCAGKTFTVQGQASGFRLHTRRSLVDDPASGLYDRDKDELVVGAHIVALPSETSAITNDQLGGTNGIPDTTATNTGISDTLFEPVGTARMLRKRQFSSPRRVPLSSSQVRFDPNVALAEHAASVPTTTDMGQRTSSANASQFSTLGPGSTMSTMSSFNSRPDHTRAL